MIAIKEQMIQTSQLDVKGGHRCAPSFLIPAHARLNATPVTIAQLDPLVCADTLDWKDAATVCGCVYV